MIHPILYLEIVTPEKVIFRQNVLSVNLPGVMGRFTILKQHAPLIAALKEGEIRVLGQFSDDVVFACKSGVVECLENKVTVLIEE
ncbi:F-type H+-transporting ATPase subunit epsilon [Breznakibacter xylanolyticus]|uniref:F-type H+-transporting ATPase subunit epsilon n=1 Tax=Breznakibacter xylanolyticus TaxID=990 RepID=A0A2W7NTS8_9BACT|nr:ATP synthase F1 subunit epsilon [Breznakibacter xylanolyticus]MBN2744594.1 ATP synthase F1 subunit epsilon [Marinilabiliaceae bacterium]PZX16736.1 F-type H+-transporting ATPase subunit epsilon [Breznakibacter xylanolyticus]